ncbi:hypothetical protein WR25_03695 [Diploscapter pachys]|uniref:CWF21 domain-containing protein n=1 Tax=Diploscapter pachys TaxID=2018661 RepID=A0A2A2LP39_9BILA|nr:hypothetical protein WR25_03695 [Diploscapter pachys]
MYNGIGLQTARGTGTNGYVQANLSSLLMSRQKIEYNGEEDLKRLEAEVNRQPNAELLLHQKKRAVEIKCMEFELLMEEKGFDQEEIDAKVSDYRKLLLSQLESGELNLDNEVSNNDSHTRRKMAADNRDRMRAALGVKKDHVAGSSFQNMNKGDVVGAALQVSKEDEEKARLLEALKKHEKEKKQKKKEKRKKQKAKGKKKRAASSSDSSSSSSDSDSDSSDSSSSSSDSDSSSDSSEEDRKKKKKKTSKKQEDNVKSTKKERSRKRSSTPDKEGRDKKDRGRSKSPDREDRDKKDRRRSKSPDREDRDRKDRRRSRSPDREDRDRKDRRRSRSPDKKRRRDRD